jgi:hypothetical protein
MEPGPYTIRELVWMSRERQTVDWDHTCALLAQTHNLHRKPGTRPYRSEELNPLRRPQRRAMSVAALHAFKDLPSQKVVVVHLPSE